MVRLVSRMYCDRSYYAVDEWLPGYALPCCRSSEYDAGFCGDECVNLA